METQRQTTADAAAIIIIIAFLLFGCFGRTVIAGKEISKLPVLAAEDCYYNNSVRFTFPRPRFDPSLYQFHVPFQLYAAEQMKQFRIPMWNPCFGCGFPTVAELQYCTFSPLRGIFQASHPYLYNLGIACKCVIAALGTFALSRLYAFSTGASSFAAITYGLCPFVMRELELPNEVELFPLIAAAFLYFTKGKSFAKTAVLGACTAVALASMHPEFFFLSMLSSLSILFCKSAFEEHGSAIQRGKNILLAGLIGVCLGAPLLLPFLELAANADSYKFHQFFIQKVSLETLLIGLVTPVSNGGSPFLGVVSLLMAVYAVIARFKKSLRLAVLAIVLCLWCSIPGPLETIKLLSVIPPRYLLAPFLLSLTLLAAQGLDACIDDVKERKCKTLAWGAAIAAVLAIAPFLVLKSGLVLTGYDGTLPSPSVAGNESITGAVSLAISCIAIAALLLLKLPGKAILLLPALLLAANFSSLSGACKTALGPTFAFSFKASEAIEKVKQSGERMTAIGQHFFYPNTSMAYGMRDFRHTGPLVPKWMSALGELSWASEPEGKIPTKRQDFFLSTKIDAASVKYVISRWPCYSRADKALVYKPFAIFSNGPLQITDGMTLKNAGYCLTGNGELFASFDWQLNPASAAHIASELDIVDEAGNLLAQGTRMEVARTGESAATRNLSILIPEFRKRKGNVYLILRIYSAFNEGMVRITQSTVPVRALGIDLLKVSPQESHFTDLSAARLKFITEDENHVLLYENTAALPQAYLSASIIAVDSLEQALKKMSTPEFDAHSKTIIETPQVEALWTSSNSELKTAQVQRPDPHTVFTNTDCDHDAFLILTDTFYNGWHAYLDGKEVPILRANVSFRAVRIPAGQHRVKFVFFPFLFYFGTAVAAATLSACLLLMAKERARPR